LGKKSRESKIKEACAGGRPRRSLEGTKVGGLGFAMRSEEESTFARRRKLVGVEKWS